MRLYSRNAVAGGICRVFQYLDLPVLLYPATVWGGPAEMIFKCKLGYEGFCSTLLPHARHANDRPIRLDAQAYDFLMDMVLSLDTIVCVALVITLRIGFLFDHNAASWNLIHNCVSVSVRGTGEADQLTTHYILNAMMLQLGFCAGLLLVTFWLVFFADW